MTQAQQLQNILLNYAETDKQKEICNRITAQMVADGMTERQIETQIVTGIYNGLRHGNWPWLFVN